MKIVFSDLDETLLVDWQVPMINREAVRKMREKGNYFVPCTGRPPFMMDEILDNLDALNKEKEYQICFNGGLILENKDRRVLFAKALTPEEVLGPVAVAKKTGLCAMIMLKDALHLLNPDPSEISRKKKQRIPVTLHEGYDLSPFAGETVYKVMLVKEQGQEFLKGIRAQYCQELEDNYAISQSSNRYLEFNPKGVSKGEAVRFLADYLGVPIENTIAVGDNYNDEAMLRAAGISACVSSAVPELKEFCDYICERDYFEGAVAEVLEKFV